MTCEGTLQLIGVPHCFMDSLAATLGAILASTDPVAVGSVLKKAGAPPRLQMHISGESLLNDGSAVSSCSFATTHSWFQRGLF